MTANHDHTGLVEQALHFGLPILDGEGDMELRKRLHRFLATTQLQERFTLDVMDSRVTEIIDEHKAAFIETWNIKRALALHWFDQERPAKFWARLGWVWRTALLLWRVR